MGKAIDDILVVARDTNFQVIVSRVKVDGGSVEWTYSLDFKYDEAPVLIDYKELGGQGHHSLATKVPTGGFTIARLKINMTDGTL